MQKLLDTMRRLRAPGGCPWDREQTHESLRPYLLEEAAEAADAISAGDLGELPGELGDVLLQVVFHSVIAEEDGAFGYEDVENSIVEKLIRRHPHVFGTVTVSGSGEVMKIALQTMARVSAICSAISTTPALCRRNAEIMGCRVMA